MSRLGDRAMTDKTFRDGLKRAEEIAVNETDKFWNKEFAHHGNRGVAGFKTTVGHLIEKAIHEAWKAAQ